MVLIELRMDENIMNVGYKISYGMIIFFKFKGLIFAMLLYFNGAKSFNASLILR